tara:strand:+ start:468 stop:905 length:438 start_codon:yes stop_codon:yes gene_type:complete
MKNFLIKGGNKISLAAFCFSALAIILSGYSIFYSRSQLSQETINMIKKEFKVLEKSNKDQILLAKHLSKIGAKLYGADWCGYTQEQKLSFGKEGTKFLNYQNCGDKENLDCDSIEAYPTWIINNKKIEGFKSLDQLKEISKYVEN